MPNNRKLNELIAALDEPTHKNRTYRLSIKSIEILDRLVMEFSHRIGAEISINKLVDSLIYYCRDASFADIVNKNKEK